MGGRVEARLGHDVQVEAHRPTGKSYDPDAFAHRFLISVGRPRSVRANKGM
jgi:hypothetical protein